MALEQESFLEASGAFRAAALCLGSIPDPPVGAGWSWGLFGCHRNSPVRPNSRSAEFRTSVMLNHCYVVLALD